MSARDAGKVTRGLSEAMRDALWVRKGHQNAVTERALRKRGLLDEKGDLNEAARAHLENDNAG